MSFPFDDDSAAFLGDDVVLDFPAHRDKLLKSLGAVEGDMVLIAGGAQQLRNHDTDLIFRQQSPFLYVCGVTLPGCSLAILSGEGSKEAETVLFVPDLDDHYPVWNGTPVPLEDWAKAAKTSKAMYMSQRCAYLTGLKDSGKLKQLFALEKSALASESDLGSELWKGLSELLVSDAPQRVKSAFSKSRASKFPGELELMRRASQISGEGHAELMRTTRPRMSEAQVDAGFQYYCCMRGCRHMAYIPIVGSGPRGAILHYNANSNGIKDGDLVLVDAGAELRGYASDITRTFPANGKFSADQRTVYEIVLKAQKAMIERCTLGVDFNKELKEEAALLLLEGLIKNDFVRGVTAEEAYAKSIHRIFMPHGLGHLVGLDVHDCNIYPETPLEEDMLITIEPGIYFNPFLIKPAFEKPDVGPHLNRALIERFLEFGGVRIEDIVHVTKEGPKVITGAAPKEIAEIERMMANRK